MRYALADLVLDLRRRTLERGGHEIVIGHRAFGVLSELVTRAGSVVSKSEFLDTVWDDAVVGEDNLTKAVGEIRTALGDSPAEARFVRTVHRRGYVFVAQVSPLEDMANPHDRCQQSRQRRPGRGSCGDRQLSPSRQR